MNFQRPEDLFVEITQEINSPLAVIRNAIYLAGCRTDDLEVRRYLNIANEEIAVITQVLRVARAQGEMLARLKSERAAAAQTSSAA
ncbi:MAG: hypothetical protein ACE14M_09570 [Terriglobales bacterium]